MAKYKAYTEYKDSNNKWLAELPAHWKLVALKHVLVMPMTDGPHETPEFIDEGVPFVSAEAVSSGQIDFNKIRGFISEADDIRFSKKYKPQLHDVYMIKSGATTGITAIVETDQHFNIWSPLAAMRCKQIYEPYFLLNYLRSDPFQKSVQLSWTFGTQQNIGMATLENLPVCFPPKEEQKKIAEFLNYETTKIDHLIEKQQQLIELLKEKRQAVISHAVTKGLDPNVPMKDSGVEWLGEVPEHWEMWKLAHAYSEIGSGTTPSTSSEEHFEGDIPWVTTGELRENTIFDTKKKVSKKTLELYPTLKKYPIGSVAIAMYGATIGRLGIFGIEATTNQACCVMSTSKVLNNNYLFYWLLAFKDEIVQLSSGGGQPNINQEKVASLKISAPQIEDQIQIANFLDNETIKIDTLIEKAKQQVLLMQERRTALISAAVTGKIDVRHWQAPSVTEAKTELSA